MKNIIFSWACLIVVGVTLVPIFSGCKPTAQKVDQSQGSVKNSEKNSESQTKNSEDAPAEINNSEAGSNTEDQFTLVGSCTLKSNDGTAVNCKEKFILNGGGVDLDIATELHQQNCGDEKVVKKKCDRERPLGACRAVLTSSVIIDYAYTDREVKASKGACLGLAKGSDKSANYQWFQKKDLGKLFQKQ